MKDLEPRPPTVDPGVHENAELLEIVKALRGRTPARILVGRSGPAYLTSTQLQLRQDHAAAMDSIHAEMDWLKSLGPEIMQQFDLFEVQTCARNKSQFLLRPDLGRRLNDRSRLEIARRCPRSVDFQIVLGDGLSPAAVAAQVPDLLPLLANEGSKRGWHMGHPFAIRYCRVGIMNCIGDLIDPKVVVLLIGERPGLATADSLSAYMAYRPHTGHTDAQRNLISNIHKRAVLPQVAAPRIIALAEKMREMEISGVTIKEQLGKSLAWLEPGGDTLYLPPKQNDA